MNTKRQFGNPNEGHLKEILNVLKKKPGSPFHYTTITAKIIQKNPDEFGVSKTPERSVNSYLSQNVNLFNSHGDGYYSLITDSAQIKSGSIRNPISLLEVSKGKFSEGAVIAITVDRYERDQIARAQCLDFFGNKCCVCGWTTSKKYKIDTDIIQVHHLNPLSSKVVRKTDPKKDLAPVCPNCHYVIHTRTPPYTIKEAKSLLRSRK